MSQLFYDYIFKHTPDFDVAMLRDFQSSVVTTNFTIVNPDEIAEMAYRSTLDKVRRRVERLAFQPTKHERYTPPPMVPQQMVDEHFGKSGLE